MSHYQPHQLRSRPLRCITLPILFVFIFIIYWLIMCPIFFSILFFRYKGKHEDYWSKIWPVYFWTTAFVTFIIISLIILCMWMCNPRKIGITNSDHYDLQNERRSFIDASPPRDNAKTIEKLNMEQINKKPPVEKVFTRCSVKRKNRPDDIDLRKENERPQSQNLSSPLSPRELFFYDLIENANKSRNSICHTFIEKEREHSLLDSPVSPGRENLDNQQSPVSEFFIANVPERKSLASEVFLFVDGNQSESANAIGVQIPNKMLEN